MVGYKENLLDSYTNEMLLKLRYIDDIEASKEMRGFHTECYSGERFSNDYGVDCKSIEERNAMIEEQRVIFNNIQNRNNKASSSDKTEKFAEEKETNNTECDVQVEDIDPKGFDNMFPEDFAPILEFDQEEYYSEPVEEKEPEVELYISLVISGHQAILKKDIIEGLPHYQQNGQFLQLRKEKTTLKNVPADNFKMIMNHILTVYPDLYEIDHVWFKIGRKKANWISVRDFHIDNIPDYVNIQKGMHIRIFDNRNQIDRMAIPYKYNSIGTIHQHSYGKNLGARRNRRSYVGKSLANYTPPKKKEEIESGWHYDEEAQKREKWKWDAEEKERNRKLYGEKPSGAELIITGVYSGETVIEYKPYSTKVIDVCIDIIKKCKQVRFFNDFTIHNCQVKIEKDDWIDLFKMNEYRTVYNTMELQFRFKPKVKYNSCVICGIVGGGACKNCDYMTYLEKRYKIFKEVVDENDEKLGQYYIEDMKKNAKQVINNKGNVESRDEVISSAFDAGKKAAETRRNLLRPISTPKTHPKFSDFQTNHGVRNEKNFQKTYPICQSRTESDLSDFQCAFTAC